MLKPFTLKTSRLTFRTFEKEDLAALYKLHTTRAVSRMMIDNIQMIEAIKKMIVLQIQHQKKFGYSLWAVIENETGKFIGRAGIINRILNNEVGEEDEIRVALFPEYWDKGYGNEIMQEIMRFARKDLKLPGLVAGHPPTNDKAFYMLKKYGFKYIKTLVNRGYYIIEIKYHTIAFPENIDHVMVATAISD